MDEDDNMPPPANDNDAGYNADGEPDDAPPDFPDVLDDDRDAQPPMPVPERPPVAPPTFQISPVRGGHECVVAMPTKDGRTLKARGRGKTAADAAGVAFRLASKALSNKRVMMLLPPQSRVMVAAASGMAKLAKNNPKAVKAASKTLKGGLRALASVFA